MRLKKKFILILSLCLMFWIFISTKSFAATASISASKTTATVGEKVTITVRITAAAGSLKVSGAGISDSLVPYDPNGEKNITTTKTYTLDTSAKGKYTVSLSGDITDIGGDNPPVNKSVTVTVNEKKTTTNNNTSKPNTSTTKPNTNTNTTKPNANTNTTKPNTNTNTTKPNNNTQKDITFSNTSGTVYTVQSTNLRSSATTKGNNVIKSLAAGTEMTVTAKSNSKVDGYYWYKVSVNGTTGYVATSLVTNTKPKESKLPTLNSLSVNPGSYSPAFSKDKTTYNVSVEDDVQKVTVKATPESGATSKITCNGATCANGIVPINEGLNTVKITVTKGGENNIYTLYIRKSIKEDEKGNISDDEKTNVDLFLKTLEITGLTISPEFDSNVYSYTVVIPEDDTRTSLDIKAVANMENAKVEIVDNENLEYGENIITIMVTSESKDTNRIYQLVVNKLQPATTETTNGNNVVGKTKNVVASNKVPVIIICTLIVIAIICIILIIKFGRKEDDFDEQLEEEVKKKDILDTEISEDAYDTNKYLNELRAKENSSELEKENEQELLSETTKAKRGKHF